MEPWAALAHSNSGSGHSGAKPFFFTNQISDTPEACTDRTQFWCVSFTVWNHSAEIKTAKYIKVKEEQQRL